MTVARVVGNIWGTKKHSGLEGLKLLLVQGLDSTTGNRIGDVAMAVDGNFGAGPGDTVLLMDEGSSARQILGNSSAPVRLVVCGIVDSVSIQGKTVKYH